MISTTIINDETIGATGSDAALATKTQLDATTTRIQLGATVSQNALFKQLEEPTLCVVVSPISIDAADAPAQFGRAAAQIPLFVSTSQADAVNQTASAVLEVVGGSYVYAWLKYPAVSADVTVVLLEDGTAEE